MKCDHKSTLMEIYLKFMLTPKLFSFTSWLHQQGVYIFTNWLRGLYHPIRELLVALALGNFFLHIINWGTRCNNKLFLPLIGFIFSLINYINVAFFFFRTLLSSNKFCKFLMAFFYGKFRLLKCFCQGKT